MVNSGKIITSIRTVYLDKCLYDQECNPTNPVELDRAQNH